MGLLACDITRAGIVMSSDSQDVLLTEGRCDPIGEGGHRQKDKIIRVKAESFSALVGYVGTEQIGSTATRAWLERFIKARLDTAGLAAFSNELGHALSEAWEAEKLDSCLWVFVAGYEGGEPFFWYVVNATGFDEFGRYTGISRAFRVVNDLDDNYLPEYTAHGLTKTQVLDDRSFQFYNGAIFPGSFIFRSFDEMIGEIARIGPPGFPRAFTLERYAFVVRQRMEFLKRLYSPKHGIHSPDAVPLVEGKVYVYALALDGTFTEAPKQLGQAKNV